MRDGIYDLVIIGAGAAGLMAAVEAGRLKLRTLVLESGDSAGAKLLISGGGRCNVTNARIGEHDYSTGNVHTLRHVLKGFSTQDAVRFFEQWRAPLLLQEDGCYFSADGKAQTVLKALLGAVAGNGVRIDYGKKVERAAFEGGRFVVSGSGFSEYSRLLLITTGGLSYPQTGSTGAGYQLALAFGHRIVPLRPSLAPLTALGDAYSGLFGIAVDVTVSLWAAGRKLYQHRGPLLFTHRGFSGPAAMEISRPWLDAVKQKGEVRVDFLPDVKVPGIDPVFHDPGQRSLKNILCGHLPERLVLVLLREAGVDGSRRPGLSEVSRKDRQALEKALRATVLPVAGSAGYSRAEVTSGGVDLNELKGASLESRLREGLYFAGEVCDVDGRIGGFNLHWAWASAVSAVRAMARNQKVG